MSLFHVKRNGRERIVIIGCGRLGASLATSLSENGNTVLVIDSNKDSLRRLPPSFGGQTIIGNATSLDVLSQAQIHHNTTVVCVTDKDNTNIMTAQMAKELFFADRVIARLHDPEKACVYQEQHVNTICPAILSAKEIYNLFGDNEQKKEEPV